MIKLKDLKFDRELLASAVFDNGLLLTVDKVMENGTHFITGLASIGGVPYETRVWESEEALENYIGTLQKIR
jgi:hypothetical protein